MTNAKHILFAQKAFFRVLFKLIRKHGIALVLQGLIEFAKTDTNDPRMKDLAKDMEKALDRYKGGEKKTVAADPASLRTVPATAENFKKGARVVCVYTSCGLKSVENGLTGEVLSDEFPYLIKWDDGHSDDDGWTVLSSFEVFV